MAEHHMQIANALLEAHDGKHTAIATAKHVTDLLVRNYPAKATGRDELIAMTVEQILVAAANPSTIAVDLFPLFDMVKPEKIRGPEAFQEVLAWGRASKVFDNEVRRRKRISRGLVPQAETGQPIAPLTLIAPRRPQLRLDVETATDVEIDEAIEASERSAMEKLPLGASRIGGLPDLPPGFPWPTSSGKKLPFIAQFQLSELPASEGIQLPRDGHLYFFAEYSDLVDQKGRFGSCRVFLHRGSPSQLVRDQSCRFRRNSRAGDEVEVFELFPIATFDPRPIDRDAPHEDLDDPRTLGWLWGEPSDSYNLSPGDCANIQLQNGDDWINLLAVESVGSMQWSDCGDLYFLIQRSSLTNLDFSNTVMVIGTS